MKSKIEDNSNPNRSEIVNLLNELAAEFEILDTKIGESYEEKELQISSTETEQALQIIHSKLGFHLDSEKKSRKQKPMARHFHLNRLAAALIMIGLLAGYLVTPVTYNAPLGEMKTIHLADGSVIDLNSGTQITHNRFFGFTIRNVSIDGEAYFRVQKGDNPFRVQANGTVTEVTGTEFNIRSWSTDPRIFTIVSVTEGHVRFFGANDRSNVVTLSKGFSSSWAYGDITPMEPEVMDQRNTLAWRNRNLSFYGQELIVIFNELERKFNIRIDIENESIANEVLTTFYSRPENVELLLDDITTVKGLSYRKTANGFYVFR